MAVTGTGRGAIATGNRLLDAARPEDLERLLPLMERVRLELKQPLYEPDSPIGHVYFPVSAVASLVNTMADGSIIETGTVGNEGIVGLPVFLGARSVPSRAFCQIPGEAWRMGSAALVKHVGTEGGALHGLLHRYAHAVIVFAMQGTACAQAHSIRQRAARWMLHTDDRVGAPEFPLTQEFLAQMLGVRRAGVSEVASELQREGLIRYSRGRIAILDRPGLAAAACECYGVIEREFDRLLG